MFLQETTELKGCNEKNRFTVDVEDNICRNFSEQICGAQVQETPVISVKPLEDNTASDLPVSTPEGTDCDSYHT